MWRRLLCSHDRFAAGIGSSLEFSIVGKNNAVERSRVSFGLLLGAEQKSCEVSARTKIPQPVCHCRGAVLSTVSIPRLGYCSSTCLSLPLSRPEYRLDCLSAQEQKYCEVLSAQSQTLFNMFVTAVSRPEVLLDSSPWLLFINCLLLP